jgi:hypothetical protein
MKNERLFLGGNRSGKTLTAAVEVARIMTGQDPFGKQPKKDGIAILVGKDLNHCGKVMAKKLFRPDASSRSSRTPTPSSGGRSIPSEWDQANVALQAARPSPHPSPPGEVYLMGEQERGDHQII